MLRATVFSLGVVLMACGGVAHAADAPLPDGRVFLPPPPAAGSLAQQDDERDFARTRTQVGTPRWALAQNDANLAADHLVRDFSCAAGFSLDPAHLPRLVALIERVGKDIEPRVTEQKAYWKRLRPFVGGQAAICTPDRAHLEQSYAYPSGHTTYGWLVASLLADLLPDRATPILERGRVFGESRIVCGVHWKSDVQAGFMNGAGLFAALQGQSWFVQAMAQARAELQAARQQAGAPDGARCTTEHQAATASVL
ncbi:acid phosphatase [Acetobacter vaccinii]|nr:phosphatase PAP2 family protein [Acetobacter vaccinii]